MARKLLSGFRLRIGDSNFDPPAVEGLPYRLRFFDSSTSSPKLVYAGPDVGDTALGSIVALDGEGYVPVSGIWLEPGRYNIAVQYALIPDPIDDDTDWGTLWVINKVEGGTVSGASSDDTIRFVNTVADIRALFGGDLGGITLNTGYYSLNDGGQGAWRWVASSMQDDDGGAYLIPTGQSPAVAGRWHRVFDGNSEVSIRLWGATPAVGDASGNIENAMNWCALTSNDSGWTLAFPAGIYNIGSAILNLDAVGLTDGGLARPVAYHVYQNARFAGAVGSSVNFYGATTVDSDTFIYTFARFTNVVNGYVKPEWWGAIGNGVADDSEALRYCSERSGDMDVLMTKTYICSSDTVSTAKHYRFIKDSFILAQTAGNITIGKVTHAGEPCFYGDLDRFTFAYDRYYSSMFNFTTNDINDLDGNFTLVWDTTHTFTANYSNEQITHDLSVSEWTIGSNTVAIKNAVLAWRQHFFYGASGTGSVNISDFPSLLAIWFGNTNVFNFQLLMNSAIAGEQSIDGQNLTYNIGTATSFIVGHDLSIRDMKLVSAGGFTCIIFTGAGTVEFKGCRFAFNSKLSDLFIDSLLTYTSFYNCNLMNGFFTIRGTSAEVVDCVIDQSTINIYSGTGIKVIKSNTVLNSVFKAYGSAALLNSIYIIRNTFRSSVTSLAGFIHLIPVGANNVFYNVLVQGNSYYYIGITNPSNIVIEGDLGVTNYWSNSASHDLLVTEEYVKGAESNTGLNGNVLLKFTEGEFTYFSDSPTYITSPTHMYFQLFGTRPITIPNASLSNIVIEGVEFIGDAVSGVTPMSGRPAVVVPVNSNITNPRLDLQYLASPAIPADGWYFQIKARVWWS